jgi:lysophospholipase L1-like esterase
VRVSLDVKNPTRPVGVPLGPEEARLQGCQVSIVGDSLTVAGGEDLTNALWGVGCSVLAIAAKGGANTWYGIRLQRDLVDANLLAPIVVALMGTNDCATPPDEFDRAIAAFLRVSGDRLVVWPTTNISKVTPYCQPSGDDVANSRIRAAGQRYPNVRVVEWWSIADQNPQWHPDGVHHTLAGRRAWAATIATGVAAAVRGSD